MKLRLSFAFLLAMQALAVSAFSGPTQKQIMAATTPQQLHDLGGHKATAVEFKSTVVGRELDEKGWVWFINADGTHTASAKDGSWKDQGGKWKMKGDRYCRNSADKPAFACSDAYLIGNFMRFGGDDGKLAGWTVRIK